MTTILTILENLAKTSSDASVLHAPGRSPLSRSALHRHVVDTARALRTHGLSRDDVIAVILPNGPELATAVLSAAVAGVAAPLNPAYGADELEFYLSDLPAKALIIAGLPESPARDVARRLGVLVIDISWSTDEPAGVFTTQAGRETVTPEELIPRESDIALVLHTSGTTSRPKIVPLTHANLSASAANVAGTLNLTPDDLCLNVMPLFHIHGLVAALLASLSAGARVACTPGFLAPSFFDWLSAMRPTWYTAVPTMHASIAARAASHEADVASHSLRLIRSSSAALPRTVFAQLEEIFGVPVVEAYGMTEAAHQMASNPLPPSSRKPGTVGPAAGPEVAVLDIEGRVLPRGERGEIAIRGPNVTAGYLRNPAANAAAFANGWLRTGDEGSFDDDGYLTIVGRLKEIINRGGEKISPLEVDEVMLDHPSVAQAVTFGAKHATLGEDVAAAVVLRSDASLTERQLREFVAARLTHFKVPRRILFMPAIPTGPTGKIQRIGLADRLGVTFDVAASAPVEHVEPRTPVEEIIASIWSSVMEDGAPGVHDNFFDAGGDSMMAAQLIARLRDSLAVDISLIAFFDAPTVAGLSAIAEQAMSSE